MINIYPGLTWQRDSNLPMFVVSSADGAREVFTYHYGMAGVICVRPPYSRVVDNLKDAILFYAECEAKENPA